MQDRAVIVQQLTREASARRPLTTAEAVRHVGVSDRLFRRLVAEGEIPRLRIGAKCVRFRVEDLDAFLDRCREAS